MYCLNSREPVTLRPGINTVVVEAPAGHVGRYEVNQMSLQAGEAGRLDFVLCARSLRAEASFDVVSEAPAVAVVPDGELVAGLEQEVRLALTTGSRHIEEVSETCAYFELSEDSIANSKYVRKHGQLFRRR